MSRSDFCILFQLKIFIKDIPMNSEITFGFAKPEDIDSMVILLDQLFEIEEDFESDPEKQKTGLRMILDHNASRLFVVKDGSRVVGMCSVQELISTAEGGKAGLIEDLVIDKNYRQQGLGSKFMKHLTDYAKESGYKRLQLLADKDNTPAINFYARENWKTTNLFGLMFGIEENK